jgi:hypothetical protein
MEKKKTNAIDVCRKISEIVNQNIQEFTANDESIKFQCSDFSVSEDVKLHYLSRSGSGIEKFSKIFNAKAESMKDVDSHSYFHYKKFEFAYDFIDKEYITLSALSNYKDSDIKEYEHFFEIVNIGTSKSYIEEKKDGFYIFCLTEDSKTERFWEEYADYYKGLCIEMEITDEDKSKSELFDLRKVCYDNGLGFHFFAQMQKELLDKTGKYLVIDGIAKFGAFYKREKYNWENETRLFMNWNWYEKQLKDSKIEYMPRTTKKFLKVPFDNDLFIIKVKSITIGKHLMPYQKEKIKELADKKGIKCVEQ